jgi:transcriptional regulator with XRE-family HTH domain
MPRIGVPAAWQKSSVSETLAAMAAHVPEMVTRLVEARKDSGLTQVQVAAPLGKPQSYVSERGERRIDPIELGAVCRDLWAGLARRLEKTLIGATQRLVSRSRKAAL